MNRSPEFLAKFGTDEHHKAILSNPKTQEHWGALNTIIKKQSPTIVNHIINLGSK